MAVALVHTLGRIAMRILVCLAGMNIEEFIQPIVTERQKPFLRHRALTRESV